MKPNQIKVSEKTCLLINWDDNSQNKITLRYLRDECPCASCKGETVLLKTYIPAKSGNLPPESYQVKNIVQVGSYAIQISWGDGHNTGIYSWDYLKQLSDDNESGKEHSYDKIV